MKIMSVWLTTILLSYASLALFSYVEDGYQEELLSAEVLQEAVLQAKAESALATRELQPNLHLLPADADSELFPQTAIHNGDVL